VPAANPAQAAVGSSFPSEKSNPPPERRATTEVQSIWKSAEGSGAFERINALRALLLDKYISGRINEGDDGGRSITNSWPTIEAR
jgi:hypothetical protein